MGKKLNKFLLLMWKNWTLLKRRPINTIFEVIFPVLICLILVGIRSFIHVSQEGQETYKSFSLPDLVTNDFCANPQNSQNVIAYSPKEDLVETTVTTLRNNFYTRCNNLTLLQLQPFDNAKDLNDRIDRDTNFAESLKMALIFNDDLKTVPEKDISLTIRLPTVDQFGASHKYSREWVTNLLFAIFQIPGPRDSKSDFGGDPNYVDRGFIYIQHIVGLALLNNGNFPDQHNISYNRFPYPAWTNDPFYISQMETMVSMMIMISFMYNYINTIRAITTEKEKQLKESMKIMGLPGWLHWTAWFTRSFIILFLATILIAIVLKLIPGKTPVLIHSDASVLIIFLLIFACSTITFSFLISVFFSKGTKETQLANTATAIGSLTFFLTYLPYILQQQGDASLISQSSVLGSSLLANTGLSFAISQILKFEALEEGIQWDNLWDTTSPDSDITFGAILLILLVDIFLYLLIALYIEAIFPGEFGVPEKWYFPFTKAYWCGKPKSISHEKAVKHKGEYFEEVTQKLPIGIQLQHLSKTFGSNKAVKDLNLDMYEGHITVLLGHNGAGKTTTMSMITGMFPPSDGTAIVGGFDVTTNIQSVRDSMGLCLQHNVLFDNLTVYEHLYFFGKLKGLLAHEIEDEINKYIELLELEDKRHSRSSTLSGGMKRKLSVGAALCGKSKVVMLDEPTAGMDPSARRAIWNLLQKQKEGRTILLTTHFMDEADLLGDRIAIMTSGQLQCCGSSFFLKRKYGAGYYLIMDIASYCNPQSVTELLQKYIPYVQIFSHVGSELTYQLSEQESSKFEHMLSDLERRSANLGIQSYGVSLTTLEEVFMKVGADHQNDSSKIYNQKEKSTTIQMVPGRESNLTGSILLRNQFIAMLLKRVLSMWRTWYMFVFQVALPIILLTITVLNARAYVPLTKYPSLEFSLDSYKVPVTLVENVANNLEYKSVLMNHEVKEVASIPETILALTKASSAVVKAHYIVGASFDGSGVTAWFNGDPYHALPLSLGLVLDAEYRKKQASIKFSIHPLPLTVEAQMNNFSAANIVGSQISMNFGYGLAFVSAFYVLFYIKERASKSKHLQFVSGVNVFIFWCTNLLWDLITYLITVCGIIITFAALQEDGYRAPDEIGRIFIVLLSFGFFMLPFLYLASYLFNIPSTGFSRVMLLGAVAGMIGVIAIQVMEIESLGLLDVAKALNWVLLFVPFFSVSKGAYDLGVIYNTKMLCGKAPSMELACLANDMCCDIHDFYAMSTPGIGRNVLISFLMFILLYFITIINEFGFFSALLNKVLHSNKFPNKEVQLEEDVQVENNKIKNTSNAVLNQEYLLVLRDVTKYYKDFLAVNGLCLGVKPYECFGLLGVNGAGKTTTFKMMTGDEQISFGEAFVNGLNIKTQQKEVQKLIGYCPQFDALLDDLTARETLKIFALIRGVPMEDCQNLGEHLAHEFDFFKHLDKQVKELSGGNKRKLSTALALIGDPPIIYLDEPTTGMDPATKRFLWTALAKLRDNGKCIILTSHSMEECEALCTRISIMVNGSFQCLGSTQRLKNKFAQGFALTIKMGKFSEEARLEKDASAIDDFVKRSFPGAELKEKYQELLSYQLVNNSMPWSHMFGILERSKRELNIEDYSLGQCSLEQVFLSFTKFQQ